MNNRFDYKESINNIKASLFDIYENQEEMIGLENNEDLRNIRLNEFIELKNITASLINKIELLYQSNLVMNTVEEQNTDNYSESINENTEVSENSEMEPTIEETQEESYDSSVDEQEEPTIVESSVEEVEQPEIEENESIEDENIDNTTNEEELQKYYLNCDFSKVNFAYVPQEIYDKIKNHESTEESFNEEMEEIPEEASEDDNTVDNHFYKQDEETPKGIIVRSDQYMKLALSRHRQAGVLEEAKEYRKEEVKRRQRENQKKELEKAELKFNI